MAYEIRSRTLGEILDGAFQLYRNHFTTFLATSAAVTLPALLGASLVNWAVTGTLSPVAQQQAGVGRFLLALLLMVPISFGSYILQNSVLTIAIADAYLGRPVSMGSAFRRTLGLLGPLVGSAVLVGLGVFLGMLLLIVPGILWMLSWLFTVQAVTVEGCGASASLKRSRSLTKGRRGRLGVLLLLLSLINFAIVWGAGAVIPDALRSLPLLGPILAQLPSILLAPLYPGVITLAYFDARVRSEAFDLEMLSRSLDGPAPLDAAVPQV